MAGFIEGVDRSQSTLFPAVLDDYSIRPAKAALRRVVDMALVDPC
jgi:hypothetical protein